MANRNVKRKQISLGQYEEIKAKQKRPKGSSEIPKSIVLLLMIPLIVFIGLILGYIFYIRRISAH